MFSRPFRALRPTTQETAVPDTIEIAGRTLSVRHRRNKRARRLTLSMERDGSGIRVTTPTHTRAREIVAFIDRQRDWIGLRLAEMPDRPLVRGGIKLPLRGQPHRIVARPGLRGVTKAVDGPDGPELQVFADDTRVPRRIADFLKAEARREIEPMAHELARRTGKRIRAIRFKDTTSRWGSCTDDGTLSFSWRIMMAPKPVIHYLVAHEVAHLTHMDHSDRFWGLCSELAPRTPECRRWLRANGAKLQAIRFTA